MLFWGCSCSSSSSFTGFFMNAYYYKYNIDGDKIKCPWAVVVYYERGMQSLHAGYEREGVSKTLKEILLHEES